MTVSRRQILFGSAAGFFGTLTGVRLFAGATAEAATTIPLQIGPTAITRTDAEWRKQLTPNQYAVLRHEATERPYTSPLNDEHRNGTFTCAGCALPVFSAKTKFESNTGWPSFWEPINRSAVGVREDRSLRSVRTEIHCARCGGHLGHVFPDGPPPTGQRYCMNGVAMNFTPVAG